MATCKDVPSFYARRYGSVSNAFRNQDDGIITNTKITNILRTITSTRTCKQLMRFVIIPSLEISKYRHAATG